MKSFSFMVAFFVAAISYNLLHDVKRPSRQSVTCSDWYEYERLNQESLAEAVLFSLVTIPITYFGVSGLLNYVRKNT